MGNTCGWESPLTDSQPELITGLTRRDVKLIKDLWYNVNHKKAFRDNGSKFFVMLFTRYPSIKSSFRDFAALNTEELKTSLSLRAHGIAVFTAIATYIDCLNDPLILKAMINKRSDKHYHRGVTYNDMEDLKEGLLDFFVKTANLRRNKDDAIAAWAKLLTFHNDMYKARVEKWQLESKISYAGNDEQLDKPGVSKSSTGVIPRKYPHFDDV